MTTTSTDDPWTRTAELQPQKRGADDAERDVIVTLYNDTTLVIGVAQPVHGDEGTGRASSDSRTYTAATHEAAAMALWSVEALLTARAEADADGNHDDRPDLMAADGQAATWLEEDF